MSAPKELFGNDLPIDAAIDIAIDDAAAAAAKSEGAAEDAKAPAPAPRLLACLRALRPRQWVKNVLVFAPLFLSRQWTEPGKVTLAALAFVAFCLAASSAYVVNDLRDLEADRRHPTRRRRPFAAGELPSRWGLSLAASLAAAALALALAALPLAAGLVLGLYLGATLAYSLRLKRVLIVDVLLLAGLYSLRVLGGGLACGIEVSHWLLVFSMFLFVSLAFAKRGAELQRQSALGQESVAWGRGYLPIDLGALRTIGATSGYLAVLVLALYVNSRQAIALYPQPQLLWAVCPLLLYWVTRLWFLAGRGALDDDPLVFALGDRPSLLCGLLCVLAVAASLA